MAVPHTRVRRNVARGLFLALALFSAPLLATGVAVSVEVEGATSSSPGARSLVQLKALLVARLVQEGFDVVPAERQHEVALRLFFRDPGWVVTASLPSSETLVRELKDLGLPRADDQLEVIQKATELVRRAHLRAAEGAAPPAEAPAPARPPVSPPVASPPPVTIRSPAPTVPRPKPAAPTQPPRVEVTVGGDLLIRGDDVDPLLRAGGRVALGPGAHWGGHLVSGVSPSSGGGLDIYEWETLAGPGRRQPVGQRMSVEAAVLGGIVFHHYAIGPESGHRVDPLALLVLTGRVRLSRWLGVELRLAPGLSRTAYTHLVGDELAWSRSRFRLEAGLSIVIQSFQ